MAAHSKHGMSIQSIALACPGAIRMGSHGKDETNTLAEKGTSVHELAEYTYKLRLSAFDFTGLKFNGYKINKPMAEAAQQYLNVLYKFDAIPTVKSSIENKVVISSIDPQRLWGTSDYIGIDIVNRVLYVGDYKNGYIHVEINKDQYVYVLDDTVNGNAQCVGYALGALDTYELWDKVDHVVTFIVQPNRDHVDGVIRHQTYTMDEMRKWWDIYKRSHELAISDKPPRKAGKHCKYCKARGFCSTRVDDTLNKIRLDTSIAFAQPDQLIEIYEHVDEMKNSLDAIKDQVLQLAREGHEVPNYKLVKGIARAICHDEDSFVSDLLDAGFDESLLFTKKLKGKTDLKNTLGKDAHKIINKHYINPEVGLTLVSNSDARVRQRPDRLASVEGLFKPVTE